jgi:hypothetical protein
MTDVKDILAERGKVHGDFSDHARFAQSLKRIAQTSPNWNALANVQTEALEMILHKVARILAGDPNHADHWDDIAGYATLVSERLGDYAASKLGPPAADAKSARPFVTNTPRGKDDPRVCDFDGAPEWLKQKGKDK